MSLAELQSAKEDDTLETKVFSVGEYEVLPHTLTEAETGLLTSLLPQGLHRPKVRLRANLFPNRIMETPAFIYAIFLWFLLISVTGYSIYVGFGPPSKELKDPFEDHED